MEPLASVAEGCGRLIDPLVETAGEYGLYDRVEPRAGDAAYIRYTCR